MFLVEECIEGFVGDLNYNSSKQLHNYYTSHISVTSCINGGKFRGVHNACMHAPKFFNRKIEASMLLHHSLSRTSRFFLLSTKFIDYVTIHPISPDPNDSISLSPSNCK